MRKASLLPAVCLISLGFLSSAASGQDSILLILQKAESSLGFYTPEGQHLTSVPVGKHPHEFVVSGDRRYAYTTDNGTMRIEQAGTGGNTVSIVDLPNRKKIGEISLGRFRRPHGIDLDPKTGYLAVSCELPDRLLIIDPSQRTVLRDYDTRGKTSHMVTLGPDAVWAYVSNSTSNNVAVIRLSTGEVKLIPTGRRPEGSVLSKDGKELFVATREDITIIDTTRQQKVGYIPTGRGPVRIGITPDGSQLVYALIDEDKVEFADPVRREVVGQVSLSGKPVSLTISRDGQYAFASAQEKDTVFVISTRERRIVREIKTTKNAGPDPVLDVVFRSSP